MTLFENGIVHIKDTQPIGTAVILHGLTSTPEEMRHLCEEVSHLGFNVIAPCLTGHGTTIEEMKKVPARRWLCDAELAFHEARHISDVPVFVIGLSFGALLGLYLGEMFPRLVSGLVVMSPPLRLRAGLSDIILRTLSHAPESFLNILGIVAKERRPAGTFAIPRKAYNFHSLGAGARIVDIRESVSRRLSRIECPLLILHDPEDHHVEFRIIRELKEAVSSGEITTKLFPNGQHELTIGPQYKEVSQAVVEWLSRNISSQSGRYAT